MGNKNGKASKTDSGFGKASKTYQKPQLKKYKAPKRVLGVTSLGISEI